MHNINDRSHDVSNMLLSLRCILKFECNGYIYKYCDEIHESQGYTRRCFYYYNTGRIKLIKQFILKSKTFLINILSLTSLFIQYTKDGTSNMSISIQHAIAVVALYPLNVCIWSPHVTNTCVIHIPSAPSTGLCMFTQLLYLCIWHQRHRFFFRIENRLLKVLFVLEN